MAASMSSAFFPASLAPAPASKNALGDPANSLDVRGVTAKTGTPLASVRAGRRTTRVHALIEVNGGKAAVNNGEKGEAAAQFSAAPSTFDNQRADWGTLFATFTDGTFGLGRIVDGRRVFRQDFPIRSYEIGADKTVSMETLMNHLQETALNHIKSVGVLGDGLGSTPKMSKRDLF